MLVSHGLLQLPAQLSLCCITSSPERLCFLQFDVRSVSVMAMTTKVSTTSYVSRNAVVHLRL